MPSNNPAMIRKSVGTIADIILFDLEDSVQPEAEKVRGRVNLSEFLANYTGVKNLYVRLNDLESGQLELDLMAVAHERVAGFVVPKVFDEKCVNQFVAKIVEFEKLKGLSEGHFSIIPIIETASAILCCDAIAKASNRIRGLAFGSEDYLQDIDGLDDNEFQSTLVAKSLIAISAKANNISAIDTVHINVHDLDELKRRLKIGRNLGFDGMLALHPKELDDIHRAYSVSTEQYREAKTIVKNYKLSNLAGKGVEMVDNKFIGPPIYKKALMQIKKYERGLRYD